MCARQTVTMVLLPGFLVGCQPWVYVDDREWMFTGRVYLDANGRFYDGEKGLPGISITDSVNFVAPAEDGSCTIAVAEDTDISVKTARVVYVPGLRTSSNMAYSKD